MQNTNGEKYKPGQCAECKAGEHEDYDDDIKMCAVRDPDTNRVTRKKLCGEHREAFAEDGIDSINSVK